MDAQPELFAQHYTEAGLNEKAVDYWLQAGRASSARAAWAEAEAQLRKGLAQLTPSSDSRERRDKELALLSALASVQGLRRGISHPLVGETRARAIELWKELGHPSEFTPLLVFQYAWHSSRGELDRGRHLAEDLLHGGEERRDNASVLLGHLIVGISDWASGAFASARAHLDKIAWLDWHWRLYALAALGSALACLGYADRARACVVAAIEEARRFQRRDTLLNVLQTAAKTLVIIGDDRAVAALADDLFVLSQEVGVPGFWMNALTYRGWVKIRSGKTADGLALLREGADAMRAIEHYVPAHHYAYEADAEAGLGRREVALVIINEALRITRARGENWLEAELVRRRGELLRDRDAVAEELFCEAVEIAQRQQAKLWELRAATSLARLWHDQGRRAEARDLLAPAYGWFAEGLETPYLKKAKALLDELTSVRAYRCFRPC
jgi:predicted ATPase